MSVDRSTKMKATAKTNPWLNFLKEFRGRHLDKKTVFQEASREWKQLTPENKERYRHWEEKPNIEKKDSTSDDENVAPAAKKVRTKK